MNQYLWSDIPVLAALSPEIAAEKLAAIGKDDLAQALKQAPQAVSTNRCLEVAIQHQGMAAHVAHVRLYSANDYVYRSPRESRRCNLGRRPRLNGRKSKSLLMCYAGARRWAIANTLIQTCKLSGIKGIRDLKPP